MSWKRMLRPLGLALTAGVMVVSVAAAQPAPPESPTPTLTVTVPPVRPADLADVQPVAPNSPPPTAEVVAPQAEPAPGAPVEPAPGAPIDRAAGQPPPPDSQLLTPDDVMPPVDPAAAAQPVPAAPGVQPTLPQQPIGEDQLIAAEFQQAQQLIQTILDDREAVGATIDTSTVDALLMNAQSLLGEAQIAFSGGNWLQARGLSRAATESATAAGALMRAQLVDYGLPSQQAQASRDLVRAYYAVDEISARSESFPSVDVSFYVTTSQALYAQAYNLYNAGVYEQAMQTAHVASQVGQIVNTILEAHGLIAGLGIGVGAPGPAGPIEGEPPGPPRGVASPAGPPAPGIAGEANEVLLTVPAPEF